MTTIKTVAEYCGVSVSTVSRALNDHPDVSNEAKAKVKAAAKKLHYVPNSSARDLVRTKSDSIGVVVRGADNTFFVPIVGAIGESCERAGYDMVLRQASARADEIKEGTELVNSKRLKGLVLLGGRYDYAREDAVSIGVPFVCCSFTNQFGNLEKDAYSSVSIDDCASAYEATKSLIAKGHRKIAVLLDSVHDHSISELRFMGYCQALEDSGLPVDQELICETVDFTMEAAYEATAELLGRRPDVTAVFSVADSMAIAAMKALYEFGRRVPEDCSVIAIDGIESSLYTTPTLTTLSQPQETLGEEAVRILVDVLEGRAQSSHIRLNTTLRPGGTVGMAR